MAGLSQFDYDVFLSYGWAGIRDAHDADRGWVAEFHRELTGQLSGELGHAARIYFDVEDSHNGSLPAKLDGAARSSVVFVSVITPGSCRADSWCHREIGAFVDDAALVLRDRRQLFSVLLRDVARTEWPEALRTVAPYEFLTTEARRRPLPQQDLADGRTPGGMLVQRLAIDIAEAWRAVQKEVGRSVLVGWANAALDARVERLSGEITARGGRVLRVNYKDGEAEDSFVARVERQSRCASLAVHLIAGTGHTRPDGWSQSIEARQIETSGKRFSDNSNRTIVWHEPTAGQDMRERSPIDAQVLRGTGFEYLQDVIKDTFTRHGGDAGAAPPPEPGAKYVFIQCAPEDAGKLDALRTALEARGIRLRLPLFQGDELRRNRANQDLIMRSHGVAVYFGSLNDLEAFDACQTLWDSIKAKDQAIPRAVVIDPPSDPIRRAFWYPEFTNYSGSAVESFAEHVLRLETV